MLRRQLHRSSLMCRVCHVGWPAMTRSPCQRFPGENWSEWLYCIFTWRFGIKLAKLKRFRTESIYPYNRFITERVIFPFSLCASHFGSRQGLRVVPVPHHSSCTGTSWPFYMKGREENDHRAQKQPRTARKNTRQERRCCSSGLIACLRAWRNRTRTAPSMLPKGGHRELPLPYCPRATTCGAHLLCPSDHGDSKSKPAVSFTFWEWQVWCPFFALGLKEAKITRRQTSVWRNIKHAFVKVWIWSDLLITTRVPRSIWGHAGDRSTWLVWCTSRGIVLFNRSKLAIGLV